MSAEQALTMATKDIKRATQVAMCNPQCCHCGFFWRTKFKSIERELSHLIFEVMHAS
jgi:hypothetical protein